MYVLNYMALRYLFMIYIKLYILDYNKDSPPHKIFRGAVHSVKFRLYKLNYMN